MTIVELKHIFVPVYKLTHIRLTNIDIIVACDDLCDDVIF